MFITFLIPLKLKANYTIKSFQSQHQYKRIHKSKFEKCRNEIDPLKGEDSFKRYIQGSEKSQLQSAWSQQYHRKGLLIPVSTFKDAVHLSPNDDYYLVTDSERNIGNMHFLRPIPEPQVTEPELLQKNKNDIVGNKILHCGKLMDMFNKFYKKHGQNEPGCELLCNWNTNNCQKWGLSWHLGLKCDNCNFCGEKTKVYTDADTDTKKGQKYSTDNLRIHVGLQTSPLGVEGLRALFLSAGIPVPSCSAMQNAGIYMSKTTVHVNETDMQERRKKLLNLNKIQMYVALINSTLFLCREINKGNNKITEHRAIF